MCGIYAKVGDVKEENANNISSRGPDEYKMITRGNVKFIFYRLAIVGVSDGMQPFTDSDKLFMCNGEIYNYRSFGRSHTGSDCECVFNLLKVRNPVHVARELDGEFAFIYYDRDVTFARDTIGIKPLFYSLDNGLEICSLVKGMSSANIQHVLPGYIYTYNGRLTMTRYKEIIWRAVGSPVLNSFYSAVRKRVFQSERPVGFFLSGGLDSSLVLSIAMFMGVRPDVFTITFDDNSSDAKASKFMIDWLRKKYGENSLKWHYIVARIVDGLEALSDVVYALETYDTTTIRASTPMYLLSKYISENTNIKVLLSGEGSDELFGGYLYFKYAQNSMEFGSEIVKLLNQLYLYDVLRSDRVTAHFGLELRPPFLDLDFMNDVLKYEYLGPYENTKQVLRNAFPDMLPDEILNGKKEAFSDAVGLSWQDSIEKYAADHLEPCEYSPHIIPKNNTAKYFQQLFYRHFGSRWSLLPRLWVPNQIWVDTNDEPSARVLSVYN